MERLVAPNVFTQWTEHYWPASDRQPAATVSGVLRAMRVPDEYAVGTLRLSVGRHTTVEDVEIGAEKIIAAAKAQREEIAALPEGERPWWCVRNVAKAFK